MSDGRVYLTAEEATSLLADTKSIHTFRSTSGMLLGADHEREALIQNIRGARVVEIGGEACRDMGHGLVLTDDIGPLFIECDDEALTAMDEAIAARKAGAK